MSPESAVCTRDESTSLESLYPYVPLQSTQLTKLMTTITVKMRDMEYTRPTDCRETVDTSLVRKGEVVTTFELLGPGTWGQG